MKRCAIEARHRLLQECNATGVEVAKAVAYLAPKGGRGQEQAMKKAERDKYLSRVGQLSRLWLGLNCPNPSCVNLWLFQAKGMHGTIGPAE
jgi:hypothetical protein